MQPKLSLLVRVNTSVYNKDEYKKKKQHHNFKDLFQVKYIAVQMTIRSYQEKDEIFNKEFQKNNK